MLWGTEAHVPVLEKRRGGAVTAVRQRQTAGYCQEETSEVLLITNLTALRCNFFFCWPASLGPVREMSKILIFMQWEKIFTVLT